MPNQVNRQHEFDATIENRYLEDYVVGDSFEYGQTSVNESQIIGFAREYDPQLIHIDPAAAAAGPFRGLVASGWQTAAIMMRLFVDHYLSRVASLGGPASDELALAAARTAGRRAPPTRDSAGGNAVPVEAGSWGAPHPGRAPGPLR